MRWMLLCALLAGAGIAVGMAMFRDVPCPDCEQAGAPCSEGQSSVVARFPLTSADAALDRERPSVAVSPEGTVLVACNSRTAPDSNSIMISVSRDRGLSFSPLRTLRSVPVRRHMAKMGGQERLMESQPLPRLAWGGGNFHLAWCEPTEADGGRLISCSTADGEAFTEPVPLHGPEVRKVHYTALAAGIDGRLLAAWLDNRGAGQQPFASTRSDSGAPASVLVDQGANSKGICPCCDLETLITPGGEEVVAYRHSVDGFRDIHLAWRPMGATEFQKAGPVSDRRWKFQACPHDGPSLAQSGDLIAAAWMDAADQKRRAFAAAGGIGSLPWKAEPLPSLHDGEQSQPRLAAAGSALGAVWLESFVENSNRRTEVMASFRNARTGAWMPAKVISIGALGAPTRPSAAMDPISGMLVAWFEQDQAGRSLVMARARPAGACCCD